LAHVAEVAAQMGLAAPPLWIDPIPLHITLDYLVAKYPREATPFVLDATVGEYDDPANQRQALLTLPITEDGNTIIYGAAGTGTETLVNTILLDLIRTHDAREFNAYILDLGAETLGVFKAAPQVGDVLFAGDEEKVNRLFDLITRQIEQRKKVLSASGKSLVDYNHDTAQPLASTLVVINDILAFYELFPKLEERLTSLTREANRYGIYFMLTSSQANGVRMRLRSNFKQNLVLMFNDPSDYMSLFGSMRGIPIPTSYARGLVSRGAVYEYQGAFVCDAETNEFAAIQRSIAEVRAAMGAGAGRGAAGTDSAVGGMGAAGGAVLEAPAIPVLPERVTLRDLAPERIPGPPIPFALYEKSLETAYLEYEETPLMRCLFTKSKDGTAFIRAFLQLLSTQQDYCEPVLIDLAKLLPENLPFDGRVIPNEAATFELFDELIELRFNHPNKPLLVLVSGIAGFLTRNDPAKTILIKTYLKTLRIDEGAVFLLFDNTSDATYTSEDWFKSQIGTKTGLWVGDGLATQTAYNLNYGAGMSVDPLVKGDRGYVVVDGMYTAVKYLMSNEALKKG